MPPFLGMYDGRACLLTDTAGSTFHVAKRVFFNDVPWQNNAINIINI